MTIFDVQYGGKWDRDACRRDVQKLWRELERDKLFDAGRMREHWAAYAAGAIACTGVSEVAAAQFADVLTLLEAERFTKEVV